MLGNTVSTASPARRRHKRRRRSRTEEKRPTKRTERVEKTTATTTCSETSQTTQVTWGRSVSVSVEKESDENRPPYINTRPQTASLKTAPLTSECDSLSFSARESNSRTMPMPTFVMEEDIHGMMAHEEMSIQGCSSMESVGRVSDDHDASEMSHLQQDTLISDAWSTDQHHTLRDGHTQEVESAPTHQLCEELRRSFTLTHTEIEEKEKVTEDLYQKCFSDNLDDTASLSVRHPYRQENGRCPLLQDDGLDAFADEEWHLDGEYVPAPYPVGLDWEE